MDARKRREFLHTLRVSTSPITPCMFLRDHPIREFLECRKNNVSLLTRENQFFAINCKWFLISNYLLARNSQPITCRRPFSWPISVLVANTVDEWLALKIIVEPRVICPESRLFVQVGCWRLPWQPVGIAKTTEVVDDRRFCGSELKTVSRQIVYRWVIDV